MMELYTKIAAFVHDAQITMAVLFGMFIQFFLGESKNAKIAITVVVSSIFVALYIVPILLEIFKLDTDSTIAISLYALSSVVSIEILAMIIAVLPKAMRERVNGYLGVKGGKT